MRVRVINTLDDLADDMAEIPVLFALKAPSVVRRYTNEGLKVAQGIAKAKSGPHGSAYFKRLTAESSGLTGEYGPHDGGTPVGAGWRHGAGNDDLPQSADIIGPKFADAVLDVADGLFW